MSDEAASCSFPECPNAAREGGLCWGHAKQRRKGQRLSPLAVRGRSPREVVLDNAFALVDADTDEASDAEYRRKEKAFWQSVYALAASPADVAQLSPGDLARALAAHRRQRTVKHTRAQVEEALRQHGGLRPAARALGYHASTLLRFLRRTQKRLDASVRDVLPGGAQQRAKGRAR